MVHRTATALAALTVVGVLGGCGQQPDPPAGAGGPAASHAAPASATRVLHITQHGGQISGDTGRVVVPQGAKVVIRVSSDTADELHVHGYDQEARIPPGGTAQVGFTADIPGVFEVELHESGKQLMSLQVS